LVQLLLGDAELARPKGPESGTGSGEKVGADGGAAGAGPQPGNGLERHELGQVFGVGPVADAAEDEGIDHLQLLQGQLDRVAERRRRQVQDLGLAILFFWQARQLKYARRLHSRPGMLSPRWTPS